MRNAILRNHLKAKFETVFQLSCTIKLNSVANHGFEHSIIKIQLLVLVRDVEKLFRKGELQN